MARSRHATGKWQRVVVTTVRGVVWLLLFGCSAQRPVVLFGPAVQVTADEYETVLAAWTRVASIYQGFDDKLFATATFHSPEFRRAFAVAFPEIYGHGGDITRRELVDLTGDVERFHNFFLAAYTPERKWNDLAKADSIWRVTLLTSNEVAVDAGEIMPVKIDANLRSVYPYLTRFDEAYLVRFPFTDMMGRMVIDRKTSEFRLRLASALGVAEMVWQVSQAVAVPE